MWSPELAKRSESEEMKRQVALGLIFNKRVKERPGIVFADCVGKVLRIVWNLCCTTRARQVSARLLPLQLS